MPESYNIPISIEPRGFSDAARQTKALTGEFQNFSMMASKVSAAMKNISAAVLGAWSIKDLADVVSTFNKGLYDLSRTTINTGQSFNELNNAVTDIAQSTKYSKMESMEFVKTVNQMTLGAKLSGSEITRLAQVIDKEYAGSLQAAGQDLNNLMNIQNKFRGVTALVNKGLSGKEIAAYSTMLRTTYGATEDQITSFQRMAKASKETGGGITETEKRLRGLTDSMQKVEKAKADVKLDFGQSSEAQLKGIYDTLGKVTEALKEIPDSLKQIAVAFGALSAIPLLGKGGAGLLGRVKGFAASIRGGGGGGGGAAAAGPVIPMPAIPAPGPVPVPRKSGAEVARGLRAQRGTPKTSGGRGGGKAGLLARAGSFAASFLGGGAEPTGVAGGAGGIESPGVLDVRIVGIAQGVNIPGLGGAIGAATGGDPAAAAADAVASVTDVAAEAKNAVKATAKVGTEAVKAGAKAGGEAAKVATKAGLASRALGGVKSLAGRGAGLVKGVGVGAIASFVGGIVGDKLEESGMKKTGAGLRAASNIGGWAATGAGIGSAIPGVGTAIGGVIGAGIGIVQSFGDIKTAVGGAYDSLTEWASTLWMGKNDVEKSMSSLNKQFALSEKMTGSWTEKFGYFWDRITGEAPNTGNEEKDKQEYVKRQVIAKQAEKLYGSTSAEDLAKTEKQARLAGYAQTAGGNVADPKTLVQEFARIQLVKQAAAKTGHLQEITSQETKAVEDAIAKGMMKPSEGQKAIEDAINTRIAQLSAEVKRGAADTSLALEYASVAGQQGNVAAAAATAKQQIGGYAQSLAKPGESAEILPEDIDNRASALDKALNTLQVDFEQILRVNEQLRGSLDSQIELATQYTGNIAQAEELLQKKARLNEQELAQVTAIRDATVGTTKEQIAALEKQNQEIMAGKNATQLTSLEKDKIQKNQIQINALVSAQQKAEAGVAKAIKTQIDLKIQEALLNQGRIDTLESEYQATEAQFSLFKDMYMGFSAGLDMQAQMYQQSKQIEKNQQDQVNSLREALSVAIAQGKSSEDQLKLRKEIAQAEMKVTQQKQRQMDLTKHIREGYLDAMMASSNAEGTFSKFLMTRDSGIAQLQRQFEAAQGPRTGILGEGATAPLMGYSKEGLVYNKAEDEKTAARMRKPIEDALGKMLPDVFVPSAETGAKMIMGEAGNVPFSAAQENLPNLKQYQEDKTRLEGAQGGQGSQGAAGQKGVVPGLATGSFRDDMIEAINKTIGGSISSLASGTATTGPAIGKKDIQEATRQGTQAGAKQGAREGSAEGTEEGARQGSKDGSKGTEAAAKSGTSSTKEMLQRTKKFQQDFLNEQKRAIPEMGRTMKEVIDPVTGALMGVRMDLEDASEEISKMSQENTIGADVEPQEFAKGGMVYGKLGGDKVPGILEHGEMVVNKEAVANNPWIKKFADGGNVKETADEKWARENRERNAKEIEAAGGWEAYQKGLKDKAKAAMEKEKNARRSIKSSDRRVQPPFPNQAHEPPWRETNPSNVKKPVESRSPAARQEADRKAQAEARKKEEEARFSAYVTRLRGTPEEIRRRQEIAEKMKARMGGDVSKAPIGRDAQAEEWRTEDGKGVIRQSSQSRGKTMYQFQREENPIEREARKKAELEDLARKSVGKVYVGGDRPEERAAIDKAQSEADDKKMSMARGLLQSGVTDEKRYQELGTDMQSVKRWTYEQAYPGMTAEKIVSQKNMFNRNIALMEQQMNRKDISDEEKQRLKEDIAAANNEKVELGEYAKVTGKESAVSRIEQEQSAKEALSAKEPGGRKFATIKSGAEMEARDAEMRAKYSGEGKVRAGEMSETTSDFLARNQEAINKSNIELQQVQHQIASQDQDSFDFEVRKEIARGKVQEQGAKEFDEWAKNAAKSAEEMRNRSQVASGQVATGTSSENLEFVKPKNWETISSKERDVLIGKFNEERERLREEEKSLKEAQSPEKVAERQSRMDRLKSFPESSPKKAQYDDEEAPLTEEEKKKKAGGPLVAMRADGGLIKKFAEGDVVPGTGNRDSVHAVLTPGEFVVRKSAAEKNLPILKQINSGKDLTQTFSEGGHVFMNTFSPVIPSPAIGMNSGGQVTSFSNTFNVQGGNFGKMMGEIREYLSNQWQYPYGGTGRRSSI